MSAEIIRFIPDRKRDRAREPATVRAIAHRSAPAPDDLTMDHVDMSPCEYNPCRREE
jgi:hypothetical protein